MNLQTALKKELKNINVDDIKDLNIKEEEKQGFMDESNVFMLIPKNKIYEKAFKSILEIKPIPKVLMEDKEFNISKFSRDFLKLLIDLTEKGDTITLKVKNDYPLIAEAKNFTFILAPKVCSD